MAVAPNYPNQNKEEKDKRKERKTDRLTVILRTARKKTQRT
jgi:hypothetical protein